MILFLLILIFFSRLKMIIFSKYHFSRPFLSPTGKLQFFPPTPKIRKCIILYPGSLETLIMADMPLLFCKNFQDRPFSFSGLDIWIRKGSIGPSLQVKGIENTVFSLLNGT